MELSGFVSLSKNELSISFSFSRKDFKNFETFEEIACF